MTTNAARQAMIDTQIRPNGVRDPRIVAAFGAVDRENFVPTSLKPVAYSDDALPVWPARGGSTERKLLSPMTLAKLLAAASPRPRDRALDIGCVTGYSTAILSKLCGTVFAVETPTALVETARSALSAAGAMNVTVNLAALPEGLLGNAPYDVILINGAVAENPVSLFDQLAEGGRLVCVVGNARFGRGTLYLKNGAAVSERPVFDAAADLLPGFERRAAFVF